MGANKSKRTPTQEQSTKKSSRKDVDLSAFPARVDRVNISGLSRTKDDYVSRAANNLFKANTFQDVIYECNNARLYLNELGIYKNVLVHIDVSKGVNASPNGYEVTFDGKEMSRIIGEAGTEIGQNEGSVKMELATPNIWGRGERLSLQGSYSNTKTTDISLCLSKPFLHTTLGDYKPEISFGLFRHSTLVPISAYRTQNVGILTDFSFLTYAPFQLSHSLQYEASFRELFTAGKHSPFFVREHCGPRMASLIRFITSYDERDNAVFPTQGLYLKTTNEFSGFGGDISYKLNNTHAEYSIPLFFGWAAQICGKIGLLQIDKQAKNAPLSSLFTLGGPLSLRGFKPGGAGPHVETFASGAHSFWVMGLNLWTPLPFNNHFGRFGNNFRTHFFYNFGNCNSFSTDNMRSAAGIGIAYRFGDRARIELNYCFPIEHLKGDRIHKGFQFGIGYEFI